MVRNADKYYFPIKESILSILPIVDEFVIALGDNEKGDKTRELIESIGSPKIKIIDRVWNEADSIGGKIYADETNFALAQCSGDWCFYIQADEVVHEKDLPEIVNQCQKHLNNKNVDALLFDYYHFFGDYEHYLPVHGWYKNEMRIVRNGIGVYSYKDAQSFRKNDNEKLNVKSIDAHIYHYGWVRPPRLMQSKKQEQEEKHYKSDKGEENINVFNYGALGNIPIFKATHPKVMDSFREKISWKNQLNYSKKAELNRPKMKHEQLKYRVITFFENLLNGGRDFFGYTNWNEV